VNRLWSRVGVRVTSVGLLVLGVVGGVYLGQDREVQQHNGLRHTAEAQLAVADADEMQLLKERHSQHAAARAYQREAEGDAAAKAAREAKAVAAKARKLEKKAIEKAAAKKAAEASKSDESSGSGGKTVEFAGPIPDSCNEFSGNRATGCALMLKAGFDIDQFPCLNKLWDKESGWNHKARNSSSGAYGIAQALPPTKMSSVADDWQTNPATQIKWGLGYIKGRYKTPCGAWSHSQSVGWY
jgi:hypothetical protein